MKKRMYCLAVCAGILCLVFWLTACSGGGSSDSGSSGITYTGQTSAAAISEDNAGSLAASALDAGSSNSAFSLNGFAALDGADPGSDAAHGPLLLGIARTLEDAVEFVDFSAASEPDVSAAAQTRDGTLSGECGGSASYSISVDSGTGAFSGSFSFSGYCVGDLTVNGGASFSGDVNTSTEQLESFTFSFNAITATSGSESVTMNGSISISASTSTMTMNMTIQDNTTGWTCKVVNYQMIVNDYGTYSEYSVSGRFFDPDYGYVDLETNQTFRVYAGDDYPSSGVLTLYGEDGSAGGRTSAVLTAVDATQCRVEVDGDGDGVYEVTVYPVLWSDL
jgi:hypothetical protein